MTKELLKIEDLHAWYGESKALHGMSFDIRRGEVVTLLGRNGAGKTTALRSIMGLMRKKQGQILFNDQELIRCSPESVTFPGWNSSTTVEPR